MNERLVGENVTLNCIRIAKRSHLCDEGVTVQSLRDPAEGQLKAPSIKGGKIFPEEVSSFFPYGLKERDTGL